MSTPAISAPELRAALLKGSGGSSGGGSGDDHEIALVDVREGGSFGRRHILLAINLPLSRLELELRRLIPRADTRIVICDGNDGLAARAAETLSAAGYDNLAILQDGIDGWAKAGFEVFSGLNVPSKAFGEIVEHRYGTPNITSEDVKAKLARGDDLVILDSRPMDEFKFMNIPGGIDVPGAELAYRVHDLAPDSDTFVVVNCAGRTRSIIGCQSLVNAGIPNQVAALTNGTMGWHLAGYGLEHGAERRYGPVTETGLARARESAARAAARFGVKRIDSAGLRAWREERDHRGLFVIDVRSPEEFLQGHLPDAQPAPGGQLVQSTDQFIGVRAARIVLVDDTEVRATMTASWLNQMGYPDVHVLAGGLDGHELVAGPYRPARPEVDRAQVGLITAADLRDSPEGSVVVDVGSSLAFRQGHIPGAWWASRARIAGGAEKLPDAARTVVTSGGGGDLARLAARDLSELLAGEVVALAGGTASWTGLGLPLEQGLAQAATENDDVFERPYDQEQNVEAAMNAYLTWEIALVEQLERDGTLIFPEFPDANP